MKIFSIKNEKLNYFNKPIYAESSNEALSYIQNVLMSDADRALLSLRGDLSLYLLGEIDFTSGKLTAVDPELILPLDDIFASIPSDRVPQTANELRKSIYNLSERLDAFDKIIKEVSKNDCKTLCKHYKKSF